MLVVIFGKPNQTKPNYDDQSSKFEKATVKVCAWEAELLFLSRSRSFNASVISRSQEEAGDEEGEEADEESYESLPYCV